jgi:hypothetical protein
MEVVGVDEVIPNGLPEKVADGRARDLTIPDRSAAGICQSSLFGTLFPLGGVHVLKVLDPPAQVSGDPFGLDAGRRYGNTSDDSMFEEDEHRQQTNRDAHVDEDGGPRSGFSVPEPDSEAQHRETRDCHAGDEGPVDALAGHQV